jgi:pimeloyl-ACP methyl ester carboxylesterase
MIRHHDFQYEGLTLRSTLHIPDGRETSRLPTVVFVHGFANNRMENRSFVQMSRLLENEGMASVRFDLSGHGESDGDFFDVTITDHAWATVPHRARLHRSSLQFLRDNLAVGR